MLSTILKSRGFWSCLGATLPAVAAQVVGDEPSGALWQQAILAWVAFLGVTFARANARAKAGAPTSYAGK